eukprot:1195285-Prorocentrum_minimum.AAC.1
MNIRAHMQPTALFPCPQVFLSCAALKPMLKPAIRVTRLVDGSSLMCGVVSACVFPCAEWRHLGPRHVPVVLPTP